MQYYFAFKTGIQLVCKNPCLIRCRLLGFLWQGKDGKETGNEIGREDEISNFDS